MTIMKFHGRMIALALLILFSCPAFAAGEVVDRIAAIVDNKVITLYEVEKVSGLIIQNFANSPEGKKLSDKQMRAKINEIKQQILRDMIEQKLLEAEVNRLGIPVNDREIDEYVEKIKSANRLSEEQLIASLATEGKSIAEFREEVKTQILREQYVQYRLKSKVEIADEDARAYYKQYQEQFVAERIITLSEIRIALAPEATAEQEEQARQKVYVIYEKLLGGADFAAMAKDESDGPTASSGGELGSWKVDTELVPRYRNAASGLKPGELATPFKDEKGYVLLKCNGWDNAGYLPYEKVANEIKMRLQKETAQREMRNLAKELYKKSFVDIKIIEF